MRGLEEPPEPGVGAPGFRAALRDVLPKTPERRRRVHGTADVTGSPPGSLRERDRSGLHGIRMAGTKDGANAAFDRFVGNHGVKYGKAVDRPVRDRDGLPAFHHFPAERRRHIGTTDPTGSVFSTVRGRTRRTRACLSRKTALPMVRRLMMSAKDSRRRLPAPNRLPEVIRGGVQ